MFVLLQTVYLFEANLYLLANTSANTHAALHKYGDVCQQMHEDPSLQRLHLQAEQKF